MLYSVTELSLQPRTADPDMPTGPTLCAVVMLTQALLWDVALPGDYMLLAWDIIMLLIILYLCFALPYTVAFAIDFVSVPTQFDRGCQLAADSSLQ